VEEEAEGVAQAEPLAFTVGAGVCVMARVVVPEPVGEGVAEPVGEGVGNTPMSVPLMPSPAKRASPHSSNGPIVASSLAVGALSAKKRAKARGAVAGAVIAGVGTALLGGNVGETALVAGAGALAGREIGRATVKRC
jgi:hypothetical protein